MLPCHSCYIYGTWRSKAVGSCKVIVWRKAEGGKSQSQMRGVGGGGGALFMGQFILQLFYQN